MSRLERLMHYAGQVVAHRVEIDGASSGPGNLPHVHSLATDATRQTQIGQLRKAYPVFRIDAARAIRGNDAVRLEFQFTCGTATFEPAVELTGLRPGETALAHTPTAQRLIRALAIVEAFSYWKAFCSPVIEVALPPYDQAELAWWQAFWPKAMGEFFYRNNINFTEPGFLQITAPPGSAAPASPAAQPSQQAPPRGDSTPPLIMFSGGKDSLALTFAARETSTSPTDFFLYNPTPRQRGLAESLTAGGRILEVSPQHSPRTARPQRREPPQRAHPLFGLPRGSRAPRRTPAGQRTGPGRELPQ